MLIADAKFSYLFKIKLSVSVYELLGKWINTASIIVIEYYSVVENLEILLKYNEEDNKFYRLLCETIGHVSYFQATLPSFYIFLCSGCKFGWYHRCIVVDIPSNVRVASSQYHWIFNFFKKILKI